MGFWISSVMVCYACGLEFYNGGSGIWDILSREKSRRRVKLFPIEK